ncbi:uncharacterized protein AAEQ78_012845 isoform 1-T3 [Lycaon pictus]
MAAPGRVCGRGAGPSLRAGPSCRAIGHRAALFSASRANRVRNSGEARNSCPWADTPFGSAAPRSARGVVSGARAGAGAGAGGGQLCLERRRRGARPGAPARGCWAAVPPRRDFKGLGPPPPLASGRHPKVGSRLRSPHVPLTVRRGQEGRQGSAPTLETPTPFRGCFHAVAGPACVPAAAWSFAFIPDSSVCRLWLRNPTPHGRDAGRRALSDTPLGAAGGSETPKLQRMGRDGMSSLIFTSYERSD